jgi:O-methyltransferase
MTIRQKISSSLNALLRSVGYALVRVDGERTPAMFADYLDARFAYEHIVILDAFAPWATDDDFITIWQQAHKHTFVDIYRCYELYQLAREVSSVPGDILEVGVWRGGSGSVLAASASRWKPEARVWLCDTFRGVVKAGVNDASYVGGEHSDTTREVVDDLISKLGLTNVSVLPGTFPDETGPLLDDCSIALCHIDVDVYQSAADIVAWLVPRMPAGGMVIFDDYGFSTCKGVTRLVHELRADGGWRFIYNLNKHAILIKL